MKPRTTYVKKILVEVFPTPIPWAPEIFESRLEDLLASSLTNMERLMLRLRSDHARRKGDADILMKFLPMLLPELFDQKLMLEIAKKTAS